MTTPLTDRFGRIHTDLRISVTDRCNFRCQYCMPAEGMEWLDRSDLLSFEEIERVARVLVERHGLQSIRLTGGEPTVRARLPILVSKLAGLGVDLSMTTNGATLPMFADDLFAAGLQRINISLDTLNPERFFELTRRNELAKVLEGMDAAVAAGFAPVKINAVLMRGINDDEVVDFLELRSEKAASPSASSSSCRSMRKGSGRPSGSSPTTRSSPWPAEYFDFEPGRAGEQPGRALRLYRRRARRRVRGVRCHRQRQRAVLRELRSDPA